MKARKALCCGIFLSGLNLFGQPVLAAAPGCLNRAEIPGAHLMQVENNGVFALNDGRAVKLEGVRLAADGVDELRRLVVGQVFDLFAALPIRDRYDRIRIHAVSEGGIWLQAELLARGLARVEIAPDRTECASELYAIETLARNHRLGLWAIPSNAIRGPLLTKEDTGTFQIVEGLVLSAEIVNGRAFLNFGPDYKTDFTITISPEDRRSFRAAKVDPRDYAGKVIRARGIVQFYNGLELEVAVPQQIEIVQ